MPIKELEKLLEILNRLSGQLPSEDETTPLEEEVCADIANLRDSLARLMEEYE